MRTEFYKEYPISELSPADYNPRKLQEDKFLKLQDSLKFFGVIKPVIVNGDNGILTAGHQRTRAMKAIGLTKTPAIKICGISKTDEIRFNLFHNSIETNKTKVLIDKQDLKLKEFVFVDASKITFNKNENPVTVKAMGDLIVKYGEWGSVVCNEDGEVLLNSDYAVTCKQLNVECLCYTIANKYQQDLFNFLNEEYGEYNYDSLGIKSYNQLHCQMNRLEGKRDRKITSTTYENYVIPRLNKNLRYIDFGAGKCKYANVLSEQGYKIQAYEPHFQKAGKLSVKEVVAQIKRVELDVKLNGLYDVVILDSVLNSVVSDEFENLVIATCNCLLKENGQLILGTRNKDFVDRLQNKGNKAVDKSRRIQFMDNNNFSATFRSGCWTMQHFHTYETLYNLISKYFYDVEVLGDKGASQIYCIANNPKRIDEAYVDKALNIEFNMEYPNNYRHNKHEKLVELIKQNLKTERK